MPVIKGELPDPFALADGTRVQTADDWLRRRAELRDLLLDIEYGPLPPAPSAVVGEPLHHHATDYGVPGAFHTQYRLRLEGGARPFSFTVDLLVPPMDGRAPGAGPYPVVINGDACWKYLTEPIAAEVLGRGYVLATFNRCELAEDVYRSDRTSGLYPVYPDVPMAAISAWAWGYHRVIDFLLSLEYIDPERICVTGHSRGGKTVLLAGATDERIAVTAPNNSGAGGAGCYRWMGDGSETLADGIRAIPYWYAPKLAEYVDREQDLPFDQHSLKALVAPRALLSTEALGDLWANPEGTFQTFAAARQVYRFLGVPERIGIWYREGEHHHGLRDWQAFLNFADQHLRGIPTEERFDINPFPEMEPGYEWRAPA